MKTKKQIKVNLMSQVSVGILSLVLFASPVLAERPALSDQFISDQYITVNNQGIFLLKNKGMRLVKYSPNTLDLQESVPLNLRARRIFSNDTRVITLTQNGINAEFHVYNGTDLSLLGSATFDRNDE